MTTTGATKLLVVLIRKQHSAFYHQLTLLYGHLQEHRIRHQAADACANTKLSELLRIQYLILLLYSILPYFSSIYSILLYCSLQDRRIRRQAAHMMAATCILIQW